jgi:hypothetical protein
MSMKNIAAIAVLFSCLCKAIAGETVACMPYHWRNVFIGGGGFVTGLITQPQTGDNFYARTDVGGAYRWDAVARRWLPLTDSFAAVDFTGIESVALDPKDTNCVYLAAGLYSGSRAAIFRSDNQGRTWQRTEVPFKMGGNESGRFNGERLVVNPNDGNILFFGSRRDGLWKSPDRGETWSRVTTFPTIENPSRHPPGAGLARAPLASSACCMTERPFTRRFRQAGRIFSAAPTEAIPGSRCRTNPPVCAPTTSSGRPTERCI